MKICVFGDATSVHLQRMIPGLVARGIAVHVVSHKEGAIEGATVERFNVPSLSVTRPFRWRSRWQRYLRQFVREFDVVTIQFLHDWGFTPELIREGAFVVSPWGSDIQPPPGEAVPGLDLLEMRRMILREAHVVTAFGPSFARMIADFASIECRDIQLMPLGVDLDLFDPALRNGRAGGLRIGYFKGFRPVYGPTYLLRAIPTVVGAFPDARFCLIGDGPQLAECKRLAALHEVESNIQWVKRQPHRNIPNYLAGWDLTVMPSICESFGAAALESSAMKVPVVASNVGGLPDTVLDGITGLTVPAAAPEQLADAMIQLLGDASLRTKMGEEGRRFVEESYCWQTILDRWVQLFDFAMERNAIMV